RVCRTHAYRADLVVGRVTCAEEVGVAGQVRDAVGERLDLLAVLVEDLEHNGHRAAAWVGIGHLDAGLPAIEAVVYQREDPDLADAADTRGRTGLPSALRCEEDLAV